MREPVDYKLNSVASEVSLVKTFSAYKERYNAIAVLAKEIASNVKLDQRDDFIKDELVYKLSAFILALDNEQEVTWDKRSVRVQYSRWDSLKHFLTGSKHVKEVTIQVPVTRITKRLCPHIQVPENAPHLRFLAFGKEPVWD